jgi:hypothetical protein
MSEVSRDKKSNKEIVLEYLQGELPLEKLTKAQLAYYEITRAIYAKLMQVQPIVSHKEILEFLTIEHEFNPRTAYRYIKEAQLIFGAFSKIDKNIHRQRAMEMALQAYKKAEEANKPREMAMAVKAYTEAGGLNREDPDLPDFSKLDASLVVVVLPEEQRSLIATLLQGGAVDLNQLPNQTIDIEHEEVQ